MPERDLGRLLAGMKPRLHDGEWVFCAAQAAGAIGTFRETEGPTAIIPREEADALSLSYSLVAAWITLEVESDLEAVGFVAAISTALATAGISCNVVSALHHDHLFVPFSLRNEAMKVLDELSRTAQ